MAVLESVSRRFLLDILCSDEFVDKLGETSLKTYATGCEHGFDVMKRVKGNLEYSKVISGTPKEIEVSDAKVDRMKYILLTVHSHPKDDEGNGYMIPSPNDFNWLYFASRLNSVTCDNARSKPMGMVITLWEEERFLRLALYQQKDVFPVEDVSKLVAMVKDGVCNVPREEYEGQYWKIVEQLNVGMMHYDVSQEGFVDRARFGWKQKKTKLLPLQGFLGKFAYDLECR